jgi:membrane protease YdiL (CAAX protease family)
MMYDVEDSLRPVDGILIFGTAYIVSAIVALLLADVLPIRATAGISSVVIFGVSLILLRFTVTDPWRYVRMRRVRPRIAFYSILSSLALILPTLSLESVIVRYVEIPDEVLEALLDMLRARSLPDFFYVWLVAAVGAALSEEFLFRGILQNCLAERIKGWVAVLITALVFGLLHTVWRLPQAFILGSFLGLLYLRTGSLIPPLLAHLTINTVAVTLVFLGETYGVEAIPAWAVEFESPSGVLVILSLAVFVTSMIAIWRLSGGAAAGSQPEPGWHGEDLE